MAFHPTLQGASLRCLSIEVCDFSCKLTMQRVTTNKNLFNIPYEEHYHKMLKILARYVGPSFKGVLVSGYD